jgi:SAM-dependent methyltransferase
VNVILAHYQRNARRVGARHSSVPFETVHSELLPWLPPPPATILDVGAGIGRDALGLAERGHRVTAAEPSGAMRRAGRRRTAGAVVWIDDRLPRLPKLRAAPTRYDFILCSAVLMHVSPQGLAASLASMADLLNPGARLAVTLRTPQVEDPSDVFFDHPDPTLVSAAAETGLEAVASGRNADSQSRPVEWRWFVFQRVQGILS